MKRDRASGSLEAVNVTAGYGKKRILGGVTLKLQRAEVLGLIGPNGAGKSTLLKVLSGVLPPWSGDVLLGGIRLRRHSRREAARRIAVAQQGGELPEGFTAQELVAMGRSPHIGLLSRESARDLELIGWAMKETGVWELRERRVWELSGGEKQRVVLARALAQQPEFLLLDEPTTHLDLRFQVEILRHVRDQAREGVGALVVLHDLNLAARACDRIALLAGGRLEAVGVPREVLQPDLIKRVYGTDVEQLGGDTDRPGILPRF